MCCFFVFFFLATDKSASGSCFGFLNGHSLPMAEVALFVLLGRLLAVVEI
jgi:hypothetical protein